MAASSIRWFLSYFHFRFGWEKAVGHSLSRGTWRTTWKRHLTEFVADFSAAHPADVPRRGRNISNTLSNQVNVASPCCRYKPSVVS